PFEELLEETPGVEAGVVADGGDPAAGRESLKLAQEEPGLGLLAGPPDALPVRRRLVVGEHPVQEGAIGLLGRPALLRARLRAVGGAPAREERDQPLLTIVAHEEVALQLAALRLGHAIAEEAEELVAVGMLFAHGSLSCPSRIQR